MFPTTGFQIVIELSSPEDPPCLGRTSYPTDGWTLACFPWKRKGYLNILFAAVDRGEGPADRGILPAGPPFCGGSPQVGRRPPGRFTGLLAKGEPGQRSQGVERASLSLTE